MKCIARRIYSSERIRFTFYISGSAATEEVKLPKCTLHSNLSFRTSCQSSNGEGGIWTLAPLLTTYSLSRRAPSATWVLLQASLTTLLSAGADLQSNGEGGIRTHAPLRTNGFQDRLVMTTSIPLQVLVLFVFWAPLSVTLVYNTKRSYTCQQVFWKKFIFLVSDGLMPQSGRFSSVTAHEMYLIIFKILRIKSVNYFFFFVKNRFCSIFICR